MCSNGVVFLYEADLYHAGCYQKVDPSSPDVDVSIPSLTPHRCRDFCTYEYRYVALVQNTRCQCLSDLSWYNVVSDGICDDVCGGTQLSCGATASTAYASIYRTTANMPFPEIEEITNCEVVVQNHYEEYGVTVNLVDVNKLVNLHIECDTGNLMMYNITMGDTDSYTLSETNSTTHIYSNTGIYNGWAAMRNEKGEVIVEFQIEVTDPIEPIVNLNLTGPTLVTTDAVMTYVMHIDTGNNMTCVISSNGMAIAQNTHVSYVASSNIPHTFVNNGTYNMTIECENFITHGESWLEVIAEEVISGFNINSSFLLAIESQCIIQWSLGAGSDLVYVASLNGTLLTLSDGDLSVSLAEYGSIFDTVGVYYGSIVVTNLVSQSSGLFEVSLERTLAGVALYPSALLVETNSVVVFNVSVAKGSNFDVLLVGDAFNDTKAFTGDVTDGWMYSYFSQSPSFATPGLYPVRLLVGNPLSKEERTVNIQVENLIMDIELQVDNATQCPVSLPMRVIHDSGVAFASTVTTFIRAIHLELSNLTVVCSSLTLNEFLDETFTCPILIGGWYNISVHLENPLSNADEWDIIRVGQEMAGVNMTLRTTFVATGENVNISVWVTTGSNVAIDMYYGDGNNDVMTSFPLGQWVQFEYAYSVAGVFRPKLLASSAMNNEVLESDSFITVEEPISGFRITGPLAFPYGQPIHVYFSFMSGGPIFVNWMFDAIEVGVASTNSTTHSGSFFMDDVTPASMGKHTLYIEIFNNVSEPVNKSVEVQVGIQLETMTMNTNATVAKTAEVFSIDYFLDYGSDVDFNVTATSIETGEILLFSKIFLSLNHTSETYMAQLSQAGVYTLKAVASNLLGSLEEIFNITVQSPIVQVDFNVTGSDSYIWPVTVTIELNPLNMPPTDVIISADMGYGIVLNTSSFEGVRPGTWRIEHVYPEDGKHNITVVISNLVSDWTQLLTVTVGEPILNCSLNVNNWVIATGMTNYINGTCFQGSNLEAELDFGDGTSRAVSFLVAGEIFSETHAYANPGLYTVSARAFNAFGEIIFNLDKLVTVQDPITSLRLNSTRRIYSDEETANLNWARTGGSNISCEITINDTIIFESQDCAMDSSIVIPAHFTGKVQSYIATLRVWNLVTPPLMSNVSFDVERLIKDLMITPTYSVWPVGANISHVLSIATGSSFQVTATYTNADTILNETYLGTRDNWFEEVGCTGSEIGVFFLEVTAHNPLVTKYKYVEFSIQGSVDNLVFLVENVSDYTVPVPITIEQSSVAYPATDMTIVVQWDTGLISYAHDETISSTLPFKLHYSYMQDGLYNVSANIFNNVSSISFTASVMVGARLNNCEMWTANATGANDVFLELNDPLFIGIICQNGSNIDGRVDFGDSEQHTNTIVAGEGSIINKFYMQPGVYLVSAVISNSFDVMGLDLANRIIVLESVADVTLRTLNGTGYTMDDEVFLEWEIAKGTNVTCRISAEGQDIYYANLCEMTGTVGVPAGLITGIGWYTAHISASNLIGETVNQTATFYIERAISGFALSTSGSQMKVYDDWTITINVTAGSNINISVVYSDEYPSYNHFYPGDNSPIQIQLNRSFTESGLYTVHVYVENTANSEVLTTTVGVAGELVGLFFSIENVTSNKEESVLYIGQEDAANHDMYTSVLIEWGDSKEAEYFPTNLITAVKPSSYTHYYTDEGFYYVNATLFNGVSTVFFDSYIRVGTPLSGLSLWLDKHMAATNDLVDACVVVSSGTNINVVIDFKDGFTRKKLLTTNVTWCAEHRYFTQDRYNITAFAQNTFNSLKTEAYLLVEPGLDDLELLIDIPVQVNQSTDIIIQFHSGIGFQYCLILDVGDGSDSYVYGTPECESKHNGSVYKRPLPETTEIAHSHTYSEEGIYKVILNAYNTLSERTLKRTAIVVFCHPPVVKLQGAGMSASLPVQYYRYRSIRLVAYIENKCATPWDITMVWNITSIPDADPTYEEIVSLDQPNSPVLELPPRTFSVGKLVVRFYAKIGPYNGIEEEDVKYLRIVPAPLVVGMEGGVARKVSMDSPLLLEASSTTYDPDEDYHDPSTFEYQWYYRPVPETGKEAKDWQPFDDSTAVTRRKRAAASGSSLSITSGTLVAGFYEILLMVTVGTKAGEFTQTVLVEAGYVPVVDIR